VAAPCGGPRVPASVGNNTGIAWLRLAAARECLRALATIQVLRGCALWRPASACERWQQYRYCVAAPCGGPQVPASVGNNTGIARRSRTIARKRLMVPLLATRYCAAEPHDCPRVPASTRWWHSLKQYYNISVTDISVTDILNLFLADCQGGIRGRGCRDHAACRCRGRGSRRWPRRAGRWPCAISPCPAPSTSSVRRGRCRCRPGCR